MTAGIYELLMARARSNGSVRRVLLGLNWSVAEVESSGLCFSPSDALRTLAWSGTLAGSPASRLVPWILEREPAAATVGAAVINALINGPDNPCLLRATALEVEGPPHLAVFSHFSDVVRGARTVVVGRYPGLEQIWRRDDYVCLERRAFPDTLPESAAADVLPRADWVFLTASAIANQTLPELLRLAQGARIVLMGPSLPWLGEWAELGVHYLAGTVVEEPGELWRVILEGGGTRIFERGVRYRLLALRG